MAGTHTAKVLLCLDKMIGHVTPFGPDFQLGGNSAANIIRTARSSPDPAVQQHAERTRESLLVRGRSEFLDLKRINRNLTSTYQLLFDPVTN